MKTAGCQHLVLSAEVGAWFRAVDLQYWNAKDPLYTAHTKTVITRYNPGLLQNPLEQFEILYLAENFQVAAFEVGALLGPLTAPIAADKTSWVHAVVQVRLQNVINLTLTSEIKKISTTYQELTGDWKGYTSRAALTKAKKAEFAPTQSLGTALFRDTDAEAFIAYSARVPTQKVLVIFPEKLRVGSFLSFQDPKTGKDIKIDGHVP